MKRIFLLTLLGLAACQTKAEALKIVCDIPNDPGFQVADAKNRAMIVAKVIESKVSNAEAMELIISPPHTSPDTRRKNIQVALDAEGISNCKMLQYWTDEKQWTPKKGAKSMPEVDQSWFERLLYKYTPY